MKKISLVFGIVFLLVVVGAVAVGMIPSAFAAAECLSGQSSCSACDRCGDCVAGCTTPFGCSPLTEFPACAACTPVNASWSCNGTTAVCGGDSCGGNTSCSGSAPSCSTGNGESCGNVVCGSNERCVLNGGGAASYCMPSSGGSCTVSANVACCDDNDCGSNERCIINNSSGTGNYCATNYSGGSSVPGKPSTAGCDAGTLVQNTSGTWSCTHQYNGYGAGGITQIIYPCDLNGGCNSKPGDGYAFPYYDHDAALAQALKDGCTGVQQVNVSPLVNPNGLNYYYSATGCPGGSTGGGTYTGGGTGTNTGTNTGSSGNLSNQQTLQIQQQTYASSLINIVNNMIQKYKSMLTSTGAGTGIITSVNTGASNITTTGTTISSNTITVNADVLNVRVAPNTQASILNKLNMGSNFSATCYVIGENVEGSTKWWEASDGSYIWAGGTTGGQSIVPCESTTATTPVFTSNASGVMRVGDSWNILVTGLNSNETIYATGGKKVNGVVPTDKTPYTANNLGILILNGTYAQDVVGDWQLVWTRADGTILGTLNFSVQ